jgi:ATP-dependent RNA helicase DeaD
LPIVTQLSEEYDMRAIAAAALQMAHDHTRPAWMRGDQGVADDAPNDDYGSRPSGDYSNKPKPVKRSRTAVGD